MSARHSIPQADIERRSLEIRLREGRKKKARLIGAKLALSKMWVRNITKVDILQATKSEQIEFYRMLLMVYWLSPKIRNAIISEYADKLGFSSVRAFKAKRNDIECGILQQEIADEVESMNGEYKGRRREAALERVAAAVGVSPNTLKVRLYRHRRRTRRD